MRLFGLVIVGLVLGRSAPALAQGQMQGTGSITGGGESPPQAQTATVKPAALVGQWAKPGTTAAFLDFRADSTFTIIGGGKANGKPFDLVGRWHLAGDTLLYSQIGTQQNGQPLKLANQNEVVPSMGGLVRTVKLEGRQLTLTQVREGGHTVVYERLGSPEP